MQRHDSTAVAVRTQVIGAILMWVVLATMFVLAATMHPGDDKCTTAGQQCKIETQQGAHR